MYNTKVVLKLSRTIAIARQIPGLSTRKSITGNVSTIGSFFLFFSIDLLFAYFYICALASSSFLLASFSASRLADLLAR